MGESGGGGGGEQQRRRQEGMHRDAQLVVVLVNPRAMSRISQNDGESSAAMLRGMMSLYRS